MSVCAIRTDNRLSSPHEARAATHSAEHVASDFVTLLDAMCGGEKTRPSLAAAPAAKAEVSRTISIAGGVRRIVITYADGTSETQVSAASSEQSHSPVAAPDSGSAWVFVMKGDSDLAPEIGTLHAATARISWRILPNGRATAGATGGVEPRNERRRDDLVPADLDTAKTGMGRLVDILL
jgi:hypothetical protein